MISANMPQPPVLDLSDGDKDTVTVRMRGQCLCRNCGWDTSRTIIVVKKLLEPLDRKVVTELIKGRSTLPICSHCFKDAVEFEQVLFRSY